MTFLIAENLSKDYRIKEKQSGFFNQLRHMIAPVHSLKNAVDQLSFSIERGEAVGFIGPNGAGKSTTMKMLAGILHPSSGHIQVGEYVPYRDRQRYVKNIGVVFGQRTQLWLDLTIIDTFKLLKKIYDIPDAQYQHNLAMFNDLLGLDKFDNKPVRKLSLGQRMRADIAAAMLHNPDIILFDEPTIGLDVIAKENVRKFIRTVNKEHQTTILLTSHDMQDIEQTCERIIIIDHGRKLYDGSVPQIKANYGRMRTVKVEFEQAPTQLEFAGVEVSRDSDKRFSFRFARDQIKVSQFIAELSGLHSIHDLTVQETPIEEIIREIYANGMAA